MTQKTFKRNKMTSESQKITAMTLNDLKETPNQNGRNSPQRHKITFETIKNYNDTI